MQFATRLWLHRSLRFSTSPETIHVVNMQALDFCSRVVSLDTLDSPVQRLRVTTATKSSLANSSNAI